MDPDTSIDLSAGVSPWVALRATGLDSRSPKPGPEILERIRRFAPDYVLFPEGRPGDPPPYPNGDRDYHPRPIEVVTDRARALHRLANPPVWFVLFPGLAVLMLWYLNWDGFPEPFPLFLLRNPIALTIAAALTGVVLLYVSRFSAPNGTASIRDAVAADVLKKLRRVSVDASRSAPIGALSNRHLVMQALGGAKEAWRGYCDLVDRDRTTKPPLYPHAIYLRVLEGPRPAALVLQFWAFYAFNHWSNNHQSDWEVSMLFFADREAASTPVAAVYSAHLGGSWRPWSEVPKRLVGDEAHPIVYVARGSHAQYFAPREGGHDVRFNTRLEGGIGRFRAGGRAFLGKSDKDYVPDVSQAEAATAAGERVESYELRLLPEVVAVPPEGDVEVWRRFWWLRYGGSWDTQASILRGPQEQVARWGDSFVWVADEGQSDTVWEFLPWVTDS